MQFLNFIISKIKNLERKRFNYSSELYLFSVRDVYRLWCSEVFHSFSSRAVPFESWPGDLPFCFERFLP